MRRGTNDASFLPGQVSVQEEQIHTDRSDSIPQKMKVYIALFDVDGCLYPSNFEHFDHDSLAKLNKNLLLHLNDHFSKKQYQRIIFGLGTNRQDFDLDFLNSVMNKTCSCVFVLPFFQKYFQRQNLNRVFIDPFMMGDIFSKYNDNSANRSVEPGSTYAITLLKGASLQRDCFKSKFDEHKISLLYTHAHRAACLNPHSNITVDFYDDRIDILKTLNDFFTSHHDLLPNNVELRLNQYIHQETVNPYDTPIKGSGACDPHYDRTIQLMSFAMPDAHAPNTFQNSKEYIYTHFLEYLKNGCALYIGDDGYEEPCNTIRTRSLFDTISKNRFLMLRNHVTSQLNSGLTAHNYLNNAALLRSYNTIGNCNLTLKEFEAILHPKGLGMDDCAPELPAISPHNNDDDDNYNFEEYHLAQFQHAWENSDNNFFFSQNTGGEAKIGMMDTEASRDGDVPEPEGAVSVAPTILSPAINEQGTINSQQTVPERKSKSTNFFSLLFGGVCCNEEEDNIRMRKNINML